MRYVGGNLLDHDQDSGKVIITGLSTVLPATVKIIATKKGTSAPVYFSGIVTRNVPDEDLFFIDANNAGRTQLDAETEVRIYDLSMNLLRTVIFHTSCSQPLSLGDQFGGIAVAGFTGISGNTAGVQPSTPLFLPVAVGDVVLIGSAVKGKNKDHLELTLRNDSMDGTATIEEVRLSWPFGNGKLKKIKDIYDPNPEILSPLFTTAFDSGSESARTIGPQEEIKFQCDFEKENISIDLGEYDIRIDFGTGALENIL